MFRSRRKNLSEAFYDITGDIRHTDRLRRPETPNFPLYMIVRNRMNIYKAGKSSLRNGGNMEQKRKNWKYRKWSAKASAESRGSVIQPSLDSI
jgi:hypothetical protein